MPPEPSNTATSTARSGNELAAVVIFFNRERQIRPGESHSDIVCWPVMALAEYLLASEDASLLEKVVPFPSTQRATTTPSRRRCGRMSNGPSRS
jgi:hypothetical protein